MGATFITLNDPAACRSPIARDLSDAACSCHQESRARSQHKKSKRDRGETCQIAAQRAWLPNSIATSTSRKTFPSRERHSVLAR